MDFFYDEVGQAFGFKYNSTEYWYIRNAQGDIIGIINNAGTQVVTYTYDAYGNPISTTGSLASTVGASNPYRYRGYYFDTETGFYYCNSRYYDPANGRWINADGMVEAGSLLPNMFMYCANNPVNMIDSSGNFPIFILVVLAVVLLSAVLVTQTGCVPKTHTITPPFEPDFDGLTDRPYIPPEPTPPSQVSDAGIGFMTDYEGGFRSTPYNDGYGNLTIGYGHLIKQGEEFISITETEARVLFSELLFMQTAKGRSVFIIDE